MLRPGFPRLSHPEVAHAIPSVGFMAQVYRRVRLLVSPTIVGVQLTDQQRTAQAPVALGKLDRAFELLDRAYDTRDVWCIFLSTMPDFDAVRSDPSFQALLRRMSFPAHVDAT